MAGIPQVITEDRASGAQFIEGSLKFDSGKGQYLKRRPTSNGNRNLWTWSGWLKRTPGALHDIFSAGQEVTNDGLYSRFRIDSDDYLNYRQWVNTSSLDAYLVSSMKLRDPSAYFHYVAIYDSNNSTNSDKVRFYINGQRVTVFSSNDYPGGTNSSWVNDSSKTHTIGGHYDGGSSADSFFNGNMSQVYFIDGQALGPENFGYTDPLTGTWRPKKFDIGAEVSKNPNNGTIWSSTTDSGLTYADGVTGIFDGNLSTRGGAPSTNNNYAILTDNVSISCTNGIRIYWNGVGSGQRYIRINGTTEIDNGSAQLTPNWSPLSSFSGTINKIEVKSASSGSWSLAAVEVDGHILIDGAANNSFYLPMDGNSPIGEDKSGIVTPNNGSIWSGSLSSSSGFRSSEPKTNAFDGNTSSICSAVGSGTITFTSPVTFASNSTIRVFLHGGNHTVTVNGGSNQTISAGSFQTVTYSNSGNSTFTMTFHRGGGADTGVRAIEIDGTILVDGQIGNSFTPVGFGGSVDLPKATGAIPILNTNEAGTVAKRGVRTDNKTYTVTASGGNYYLDGALKPTLNAYRGGSYTFDYTGATSHPFYLSSLPDGKHNSKAYSVSFDGTGDYLGVTGSSDYDFGTGDFTIEGYFYTTNTNGTIASSQNYHSGGNNGNWLIRVSSPGQIAFASYDGTGNEEYTEFNVPYKTNTWHHFAYVKIGTTLTCYLDGSSFGTLTVNKSLSDGSNGILIGEDGGNLNPEFNGKISNFRINKGTALYTSNFTPPGTTLTNVTGTTLLCCQDSNATTSAVLASGSTITANGNAAASNTSPFLYDTNGYYGVNTATSNTTKITIPHTAADTLYYYCHNHSGMGSSINVTTDIFKADPYAWKCMFAMASDMIDHSPEINVNSTATSFGDIHTTTPQGLRNLYGHSKKMETGGGFRIDMELTTAEANAKHQWGTGDFTIECWHYQDGGQTSWQSLFRSASYNNSSLGSVGIAHYANGQTLFPYWGGGGNAGNFGQTGNVVPYKKWNHTAWTRQGGVNRIFANGVIVKTFTDSRSYDNRGFEMGDAYTWNGGYQDARIYNGVAKYTSDFVVPATSPDILPDTPSGITGKTNLTKITEGAVSFDGSDDYLSLASTSDFDFGTGDFTCELFFRCTNYSNTPYFFDFRTTGGAESGAYAIYVQSTGEIVFWYNGSNRVISNGKITLNSWVHLAVVRSSGTTKMYIDGVAQTSSYSDSNDYGDGGSPLLVGVRRNAGSALANQSWNGQLSNVRVLNGTALYTSDFTPPTEPLTEVTNTKLLCCQSNTSANAAAVSPNVSGLNDGTAWSSYFTGNHDSTHGWGTLYKASNAFDGNLNSMAIGQVDAEGLTWTAPGGGIGANATTIRIYGNDDNCPDDYLKINGINYGGLITQGFGPDWTVLKGTGAVGAGITQLESVYLRDNSAGNQHYRWRALEIDGTVIVDPLISNGDAAATNFNPFTDDINTIRGQETGYATLNPLAFYSNSLALSNGNLTCTSDSAGSNEYAFGNMRLNGRKIYYEFSLDNAANIPGSSSCRVGICRNLNGAASEIVIYNGTGNFETLGTTDSTGASGRTYSTGDIIGLAIDCIDGSVQYFRNGIKVGTKTFTVGTDDWTPHIRIYVNSGNPAVTTSFNFGQKPFKFPPPDGFQPLNLSNVQPEKVIARPDQYVDVITYSGDGNSGRKVTGLNFDSKPDFVWIKVRNETNSHYLFDTVRGADIALFTDLPNGENDYSGSGGRMPSFDYNGFTVNYSSSTGTNASGDNYVAWCWKAGGDKNTFNIDDVGYANASDVNMNVGALNDVTYNQDQNWGSLMSVSPGTFDQSPNFAFNGLISGGSNRLRTSDNNATVTMDLSAAPVTVSSQIKVIGEPGYTSSCTVTVGGVTYTSTFVQSTGAHTFNVSGSLTQMVLTGTSSGGRTYMEQMEIDGKILVNSGTTINSPSIAPTGCSVNTKSKFGIYTYTGSGSGSGTLSHGLEGTPGLVIYKKRNSSSSWQVYHQSLGGTVYNTLDEDVGDYTSDSTRFGGTNPTSSIITLGTHGNGADDTIMYAWCDVPGLQKFGKWTGVNSADGTFVELGFRPALVIAKESSATGSGAQWFMLDSSRNTYNPLNNILDANRGNGERQGVIYDFLSNGFKIRTTFNSGATFIYMAWAEAPSINLYGGQSNAR